MKIVLVTGSHPRHAYIARKLAGSGCLSGIIIEEREAHLPVPPKHLSADLKRLYTHHFQRREAVEQRFFSESSFPAVACLKTSNSKLNAAPTHEFICRHKPDLLLSYGCHMLSPETLSAVEGEKWNIHGGLSPWYRGAITHFWPSYMLEPQMTGITVHELSPQLDAGDVVHQCCAPLIKGDGLHELAARAVLQVAEELEPLISVLQKNKCIIKTPQRTTGKLWLGRDWRPEHLRLIYELYDDSIVDRYLDGMIAKREPRLIRQF